MSIVSKRTAGKTGWMTPPRELRRLLPGLLPEQGAWSEEDHLFLTDSATRLIEYTDGFVEILPMPTTRHQRILGRPFRRFGDWVEPRGSEADFAPLPLRVRRGKFREPDLLALLSKDEPRLQERRSSSRVLTSTCIGYSTQVDSDTSPQSWSAWE